LKRGGEKQRLPRCGANLKSEGSIERVAGQTKESIKNVCSLENENFEKKALTKLC